MSVMETYQQWLTFDIDTRNELESITDETEVEDRFCKELAFGTGGMRGIMGAGSNRINRYTIRKAAAGLGDYLLANGLPPKVVIAYDTRHHSKTFAQETATVLNKKGISVSLFSEPTPTPVLSFAVRYLEASAGVVITASHNPKEYNGFKVYNKDGGQLVPHEALELTSFIQNYTSHDLVVEKSHTNSYTTKLNEEVLAAYLKEVNKQSIYSGQLTVVYSPLHGAGNKIVRRALKNFTVSTVEEQVKPDGDFPTVDSPNPEERTALLLGILQAEKKHADLVIATDPDCDRLGAAVKHGNCFRLLTGNQIGALLVDFVLSHKKVSNKATLIKTIVTNELGAEIAKKHGLHVMNTLTGFKYIGEKINRFDQSKEKEFIIGYEESYGFLVGTHCRDKDAVVSALLLCQMASYYKKQGLTLIDRLSQLFKEYNYYLDALDSFVYKGLEGTRKIEHIMSYFREAGHLFISNIKDVIDYSQGIEDLPKENVLKFIMNNDSWIAIRPSGTEPKLKVYYSIKETDEVEAKRVLREMRECIKEVVN